STVLIPITRARPGCRRWVSALAAAVSMPPAPLRTRPGHRLRLWQEAQLLQQAEPIGDAPVLDHPPILEAADVDHVDRDRLARVRQPEEPRARDAAAPQARPDLV